MMVFARIFAYFSAFALAFKFLGSLRTMSIRIAAVGFHHGVSAGFQVEGNDTCTVGHIVTNLSASRVLDSEVPTLNGTAVGSSLDDLRLTPILVLEGDLCGLTCLYSNGLGRSGVVDPEFTLAVRFCHLIRARFEIQSDDAGVIGHIIANFGATGGLDSKVPTFNGTTVGCSLDDLRLASPLVGEGHAGGLTCLNRK